MNIQEIREKLVSLSETKYGDFTTKISGGGYPVLGVRIPKVEELAKEILAKNQEDAILENLKPKNREEMHLFSFLLAGKIKKQGLSRAEFLAHISRFDSWETVDLFCARLKSIKKNREEWLGFIDELLKPNQGEFVVRTGVVLLLDYYVLEEYLQVVFEEILKVKDRDEYYIKMAVAWLIQVCFVYFPETTFEFMKDAKLPEFTLKKTVSKIQDSYRINQDWKKKAKSLII